MPPQPDNKRFETTETKDAGTNGAKLAPDAVSSDAPATVLSDPAIRFQESRNVALFLELMKTKDVRLKEAD